MYCIKNVHICANKSILNLRIEEIKALASALSDAILLLQIRMNVMHCVASSNSDETFISSISTVRNPTYKFYGRNI